MASNQPDPTERRARLAEALKLFKPRDKINLSQLALAAGIPDRLMSREVKADSKFPVKTYGAEGVEYEFYAVKAIKYMIGVCDAKIAARRSKMDLISTLSGLEIPTSASRDFGIAELKQIDQIQTSTQKRKIEQSIYVLRTHHESCITELATLVQTEVLSAASRLDASGQWPPEIRASVEEALKDILVVIHDKAMELFSELGNQQRA